MVPGKDAVGDVAEDMVGDGVEPSSMGRVCGALDAS
jgi:hypothetical protein